MTAPTTDTPLPAGPIPDTLLIPVEQLANLAADRERLRRLIAFLGATVVDTRFFRQQSTEYPKPDTWIMGYSIETEHDGCYEFCRLAEGVDPIETLDAGLAAWDEEYRLALWQGEDQ